MTSVDRVTRKLDIARVFADTFAVVRRQAPLLFGLTFVLSLLPSVLTSYINLSLVAARGANAAAPLAALRSPAYPLLVIVNLVLASLVLGAQLGVTIDDLEGRRPSLQQALRLALRKCLPVLAGLILMTLGVTLGALLLFVPGVILGVMWIATLPALVGEGSNVFQAFGRSRALTRGNRWRIFGLVVLAWFVLIVVEGVIAGSMGVVGIRSGHPGPDLLVLLVMGVLGWISSVLLTTGMGALYVQLRDLKGAGGESVAQVFA